MLSKKIEKVFNEQINWEFYSSYFYLAMAVYCESIDLPGFADWLDVQSQEEYDHAIRLIKFVQDRDGQVIMDKIDKPQTSYKNILDVFENVLEHEQFVTKRINDIYALAVKENDYASQVEIQWFIREQVEEEKTAKDIVKQIKWIGDQHTALYMLDQKMSERQPAPASTAE